jgi:hypothetical protein
VKSVLLSAGITPSYIIVTGLTNACLRCSSLNFEVLSPFFVLRLCLGLLGVNHWTLITVNFNYRTLSIFLFDLLFSGFSE